MRSIRANSRDARTAPPPPMRTKLLFICSRNQWRSPTAEDLFRDHAEYEARSAGTSDSARVRVGSWRLPERAAANRKSSFRYLNPHSWTARRTTSAVYARASGWVKSNAPVKPFQKNPAFTGLPYFPRSSQSGCSEARFDLVCRIKGANHRPGTRPPCRARAASPVIPSGKAGAKENQSPDLIQMQSQISPSMRNILASCFVVIKPFFWLGRVLWPHA